MQSTFMCNTFQYYHGVFMSSDVMKMSTIRDAGFTVSRTEPTHVRGTHSDISFVTKYKVLYIK